MANTERSRPLFTSSREFAGDATIGGSIAICCYRSAQLRPDPSMCLSSSNGPVLVLGQRGFPELGQEQVQTFKGNGLRGSDLHTDSSSRRAIVDNKKAVLRSH